MSKPLTPVYASTACLPAVESFEERIETWVAAGLERIEAGNYPNVVAAKAIEALATSPAKVLLHNYFPPPKDSIVLNLASPNKNNLSKTRQFLQRSIEYSAELGAEWYSFHGGFIFDPCGRDEFGFEFPVATEKDKAEALFRFTTELVDLSTFAQGCGVALLVENNVCKLASKDKLLLATPAEFAELFKMLPQNDTVGILLDTGHMKVSAKTYGFSVEEFLPLRQHIWGVHLHDNDGDVDQHLPAGAGNWATNFCREVDPRYVSLEGLYDSLGSLVSGVTEISSELNGGGDG